MPRKLRPSFIGITFLFMGVISCKPMSDQITDASGISMKLVPAGEFYSTIIAETEIERVVQEMYLDDFYIDTHEVTNQLYSTCVDAGECNEPVNILPYSDPTLTDHPVFFVTLDMAEAFCEWRDARLPTRAEWEKAAGGELDEIDYYWGYETPVCQQGTPRGVGIAPRVDYSPETIPAGSSSPNEYGLFEMTGGLWEWVSDPYEPGAAAQSPDTVSFMRLFRSGGYGPQYNRYVCSFRCAKSP